MNPIRSRSDSTLFRGATLLITVLMLAVINVLPLLDVGYNDTSSAHIEEPDGSPAHHGAKHDHALCGLIASAHLLPGTTQVIATASTHTVEVGS